MAEKPIGSMKFGIGVDGLDQTITTLDKLNKAIKQQESAMKANLSTFDKAGVSAEKLQQKEKDLATATDLQAKKVDILTKRRDDAIKKYGEESDQVRNLNTQINNASAKYNNMQRDLQKTTAELVKFENGLGSVGKDLKENAKDFNTQANAMDKAGDKMGALETKQAGLKRQSDLLKQAISGQENAIQQLTQKFGKSSTEVGKAEQELAEFKRQLNNTDSELDSVSKGMQELGKSSGETSEGLGLASKGLQGLVAGVGMSVATKAMDMISDAVGEVIDNINSGIEAVDRFKAAFDWDAESAQAVSRLANELVAEGLSDNLDEVAQSMIDVQNAMGNMGMDDETLQNMTRNAIAFAKATGGDAKEAIRGVSRMMQNFGIEADYAWDLMARGASLGLDQTDELGDNMAEYSQLWGQMGFSASETFEMLQNGLDNGAYNLDKVNDLVKEMGISLTDGRFEDNIGMFSGKTQELFQAWKNGGATQAQVIHAMIDDFGNMEGQYDALNKAGTIWSALGEDNSLQVIKSLNNTTMAYENVEGAQENMNNAMSNTTGMDAFKSSLKAVGNEIGISLNPMFGAMASGITNFTKKVLPMIEPALKKMWEYAQPILEKLTQYLGTSFKVAGDIMGTVIKYISDELIPYIMPKLQALGDRLGAVFDRVTKWWDENGKGIMEAIKKWLELLTPIFKIAIDIVMSFVDSVVGLIEGFFDVIEGATKIFKGIFNGDWKQMWDGIKQLVWGAIQVIWNWINISFFGKILKGVKGFGGTFKNAISSMWTAVKNFFKGGIANVNGAISGWFSNSTRIVTNLKNSVSGTISSLWKGIKNTFSNGIDTIIRWFSSLPQRLGDAISRGAGHVTGAFKGIFNKVLKAIGGPVNGIIGGANWVLEKFGAPQIPRWDVPQYANGTDGHIGGPMVVNDGAGAEMVIAPNGQAMIPKGRNVMMNAPAGTQVLNAKETSMVLGKKGRVPFYKNGTGFLDGVRDMWDNTKSWVGNGIHKVKETIGDIMDWAKKPLDLARNAIMGAINLDGITGVALDMAKGLGTKATHAFAEKVKALFKKKEEEERVSGPVDGNWRPLIIKASKEMGANASESEINGILAQIQRESGGNEKIVQSSAVWDVNTASGNPARGLLQYIPQTFDAYKVKGHENIYSGYDQLLAFFNNTNWRQDLPYGKSGWGPSGGRVRGYYNGGIAKSPQLATLAENGYPEFIIPTEPAKRGRAMALLNQAKQALGVKDERNTPKQGTATDFATLVSLMQQQNELLQAILAKNTDVVLDGKKVNKTLNELDRTAERNRSRDLGLI
jgi:SLT domain-containing protein/phage-related minor tail protein